MRNDSPLGIKLIAGLFIFGSIAIIWTVLFLDMSLEKIGLSTRIGLPFIPEIAARIGYAILSLVLAIGLIKLTKWGFWLFEVYNIYMFIVSLILCIIKYDNLFLGNMVSALLFLVYIYKNKKFFNLKN